MVSVLIGLKRIHNSAKQLLSFSALAINEQASSVMSMFSMLSIFSEISCSSVVNRILAALDDSFVLYMLSVSSAVEGWDNPKYEDFPTYT